MTELIELGDGLFVLPHAVAAVKRSALNEEHCTVFLKGQSSQDGFLVERDADEVVEMLNAALTEEDE